MAPARVAFAGHLGLLLGFLPPRLGFFAVQRPQELEDLIRRVAAVDVIAHTEPGGLRLLQGGVEGMAVRPLTGARPRALA